MSITINNVETLNVTTLNNNNNNNTSFPLKVCSQCHQNKLLTDYNKDIKKSDNLICNCKSCQSIASKLYRDNNINNENNVNKQINANKIYDENEIKICPKCKESKLIMEYNKDRTSLSGLHSFGKLCESILKTRYRNNNRQMNANRIFTENDDKICCKCKQQKLYTEFNKYIYKKSGLDLYCKDCIANDPKTQFRQEFFKAISDAFKNKYNNYLSIIGCDAQFLKTMV